MDFRLSGPKQRLREYIQFTGPRKHWASPDILSEAAWLRSKQTLQRNYFPIAAVNVVALCCSCSLIRVKVFRIENAVSLKCWRPEARLWVVCTF